METIGDVVLKGYEKGGGLYGLVARQVRKDMEEEEKDVGSRHGKEA